MPAAVAVREAALTTQDHRGARPLLELHNHDLILDHRRSPRSSLRQRPGPGVTNVAASTASRWLRQFADLGARQVGAVRNRGVVWDPSN